MALEGMLQVSNEAECGFSVKGLGRLFERHWSEDSTVAPAHGFLSRQNSDPVEATSGTWSHLEGQPDWAAECRDLAPIASQSGVHRNAARSSCKTGRICDCDAVGCDQGFDVDFFEQRGGCVDAVKIQMGALQRNPPKKLVYCIGGRICDVENFDDMQEDSEWDSLTVRGRCIGQVHARDRIACGSVEAESNIERPRGSHCWHKNAARSTLHRTRIGRVCDLDDASNKPEDSESDIFECRRSNLATAAVPISGLQFAYCKSGRICDAGDISSFGKADMDLHDWRGQCVAAGNSASSTRQKAQVQAAYQKTQSGRICDLLGAGSNAKDGEVHPFEGCGAREAIVVFPGIAGNSQATGYCKSGRIWDADSYFHGEIETDFYDLRGRRVTRGHFASSTLQKAQTQIGEEKTRCGRVCDLTCVNVAAHNGEMDLLDGRGSCKGKTANSEVACNPRRLAYCKSGRICDADDHAAHRDIGTDPYDRRGHRSSAWVLGSSTKQTIQAQEGYQRTRSGRICDLADMSKTTEAGDEDLFEGRGTCMKAAGVPNIAKATYCRTGRICDVGDLGHHGQVDPCIYEARFLSMAAHKVQSGLEPRNTSTSGRICELDGTSDVDEFDSYEGRQRIKAKAEAAECSSWKVELPYCASGRTCDLESTWIRSNL